MLYPSIDKILTTIDSKYALVHLVSKRSKEIMLENNLLMNDEDYKQEKEIGKALEEIAGGFLIYQK